MFDPINLGEYVFICDLCKALYKKFKAIQGQNEGIILFSHHLMYDLNQLQNFVQILVSQEFIKKIYILEVKWVKISKPTTSISEGISQRRLKKSEFLELNKDQFEYSVIYEIFKAKYY